MVLGTSTGPALGSRLLPRFRCTKPWLEEKEMSLGGAFLGHISYEVRHTPWVTNTVVAVALRAWHTVPGKVSLGGPREQVFTRGGEINSREDQPFLPVLKPPYPADSCHRDSPLCNAIELWAVCRSEILPDATLSVKVSRRSPPPI